MTRFLVHRTFVEIEAGDIIGETTDAIVNAAQRSLQPGCGVDGHIHGWGGPQIQRECALIGGCETGDAVITSAGELEARHIIHTVGPIWSGGAAGEPELLARCYRRCLQIAAGNDVKSLAFPAISCGDYGYPLELAAPIAMRTVADWSRENEHSGNEPLQLVRFVLKGRRALDAYDAASRYLQNWEAFR